MTIAWLQRQAKQLRTLNRALPKVPTSEYPLPAVDISVEAGPFFGKMCGIDFGTPDPSAFVVVRRDRGETRVLSVHQTHDGAQYAADWERRRHAT